MLNPSSSSSSSSSPSSSAPNLLSNYIQKAPNCTPLPAHHHHHHHHNQLHNYPKLNSNRRLYPLPQSSIASSCISSISGSISSSSISNHIVDPHSDATDCSPRSVIRHIHSSSSAPSPECRPSSCTVTSTNAVITTPHQDINLSINPNLPTYFCDQNQGSPLVFRNQVAAAPDHHLQPWSSSTALPSRSPSAYAYTGPDEMIHFYKQDQRTRGEGNDLEGTMLSEPISTLVFQSRAIDKKATSASLSSYINPRHIEAGDDYIKGFDVKRSPSSRKGGGSVDSWKHREIGSPSKSNVSHGLGSVERAPIHNQAANQVNQAVNQSNQGAYQAKRSGNNDILNRFAAANHANNSSFKLMQFRSIDHGQIMDSYSMSCPSRTSNSALKQISSGNFTATRAPKSPDALLNYVGGQSTGSVLKVVDHPVSTSKYCNNYHRTNCSKWEDAEKWLIHDNGCRGFASNTLRMLGKSCTNAGTTTSNTLGSPAQQLHCHHKSLVNPRQIVHVDCFNPQLSANPIAKYTIHGLDGAPQTPQTIHQKGQLLKHRSSLEKQDAASPNHNLIYTEQLHQNDHNPGSKSPISQLPARQMRHGYRNQGSKSPINQPAETTILIDRRQVNGWIPPPRATNHESEKPSQLLSKCRAECNNQSENHTDRFANGGSCTLGDAGVNVMSRGHLMKEAVVVSASLREVGTQITSIDGSNNTSRYTSKSGSPQRTLSPARHNTPARMRAMHGGGMQNTGRGQLDLVELANCHRAKLELEALSEGERIRSFHRAASAWSSREVEEAELSRSLRHSTDLEEQEGVPTPISEWKKDEHAKLAKLQLKEAKIEAWVNDKKNKADLQLKKLEAKLEKQRSQTTNKIMGMLVVAQRQAEEMRANARAQQNKTSMKARIRHRSHSPISRCVCFTSMP